MTGINTDEQLLKIAEHMGSMDATASSMDKKMDTVVRQATQHDKRIVDLEVNEGRQDEQIKTLTTRVDRAGGYSKRQVASVAAGSGVIGALLKAAGEYFGK